MLIRLYANREAIQKRDSDLLWILSIPGKTIYAKIVIIDTLGVTVFDPNPDARPSAYLEFEGDLQKAEDGHYAIIPLRDGKPKRP